MPKKLTLTKPAYENLLTHLVDFEEKRTQIINLYFPEYNRQREEFEELIDNYISALDQVVKGVSLSDKSDDNFPFVCLYSVVEIEDIEMNETFSYTLVVPEDSNNKNNCITILSPMGKALLCKKEVKLFRLMLPPECTDIELNQ
jgi:transcription elongation factor GreA